MHARYVRTILIAALGFVLLGGAGCAEKDIQATSDGEFAAGEQGRPGSGSGGGSGASGEQGIGEMPPGFSEGEIASNELGGSGPGGAGTEGFGGPGGSGGAGAEGFGGPGGSAGSRRSGSAGGFEGDGETESVMGSGGAGDGDGPFPSLSSPGSAKAEGEQGSLSGFDQLDPGETPGEDRVGDGTMIAKADPSEAFSSEMEALQRSRREAASGELHDIFFGYDSWRISNEGRESLRRNAEWMRTNPSAQLMVEGHCDQRGASAYNLVLGEKRAKALRRYMLELGIRGQRVRIVSYGEERPFCQSTTETCYQLNRRGHFVLQ